MWGEGRRDRYVQVRKPRGNPETRVWDGPREGGGDEAPGHIYGEGDPSATPNSTVGHPRCLSRTLPFSIVSTLHTPVLSFPPVAFGVREKGLPARESPVDGRRRNDLGSRPGRHGGSRPPDKRVGAPTGTEERRVPVRGGSHFYVSPGRGTGKPRGVGHRRKKGCRAPSLKAPGPWPCQSLDFHRRHRIELSEVIERPATAQGETSAQKSPRRRDPYLRVRDDEGP